MKDRKALTNFSFIIK